MVLCEVPCIGQVHEAAKISCKSFSALFTVSNKSDLDSVQEVWTSFAIVVRIAMLMAIIGMQSSSWDPEIAAFDHEMPPRTWPVIQQLNLLSSFQMGLPGLVQVDAPDVGLPRNLLDDDFDEPTPLLPASRPYTKSTEIAYFIVKSRIVSIVQVVAISLAIRAVSFVEVMAVDSQRRHAQEATPKEQSRDLSPTQHSSLWRASTVSCYVRRIFACYIGKTSTAIQDIRGLGKYAPVRLCGATIAMNCHRHHIT